MSKILLERLTADLDPHTRAQLEANPDIQKLPEEYLAELFQNENLLSTDIFTTTTNDDPNRQKTLTEEIAELDDQQHKVDVDVANITNENRDLIIDISQDLKHINETITSEMQSEVQSIGKLLKPDDKSAYQIFISEQSTRSLDVNSSILSNIDSILDLLELPTLCKICTLQGNYQEALEISMFSKSLIVKFPNMSIFTKINNQINKELNLMIKKLIKLLNTNLKQNNLIKIFNILNQLDLTNLGKDLINPTETEEKTRFLKLIYLNSRFKYILNEIANLKPLLKFNKFTYLKRYIEVYRGEIYHSISMFYTILNSLNLTSNEPEDNLLINQFVKNLAYLLVDQLKQHLPKSIDDDSDIKNQLDGMILQIIYLCKSLSKYHINFGDIITWELCYNEPVINESDWLNNLSRVKSFRG